MDVVKRFQSMRLTADEEQQLFFHLMDKVEPKGDQEVGLISFAEIFDEAKEIADNGNKFSGLSTGYKSLDKMTMGLNGGDLVVFFGYTSMGKSQLGQNVGVNVVKAGIPVLFMGFELTNRQNGGRFIRMGANDRNLPFLFPDTADIHYTSIQKAIKKAKAEGCGLVVVDQLQDLIHDKVNEQGEITQIMAELKRAAIAYDVPIIVMSHVNREGAQPGPPPLSALKGSSSIEQKADICISVYQDKEAEPGDGLYKKMAVALRKNRQKGMEFTMARFKVGQDMRLEDEDDFDNMNKMFPGLEKVKQVEFLPIK